MTRQNAVSFFKAVAYIGVYGGLLMPLMFIPYVIFPFVFSKLIFFQVLVGLTFPAYATLAWMEPRYRPPRSLLFMAIGAYFVAVALSVVFSTDIHRSWWGNQERMNGLFTLLHFLAWLTMTIGLLKTWTDWKRLLNYEIGLSVFMATISLLQLVKKDILLFTAGDRIGGLLDNPIYMGTYQMFNLAFLALLFIKTKSRAVRAWYLVAAAADIAAFALTQSRGAVVGLVAVIGAFALYSALFTGNKKIRFAVIGAAALFFAMCGGIYVARDTPLIAGNAILNRLTHFTLASETRFIAWDIAWKGFLERPLTGWGMDAYHILFNLKYNPKSLEFGQYETWFDRAHNTVMDVLAMTGIFGFITFFAIFAVLFVTVWRARKRGWIDLPTAGVLTALPIGYFLQNLFVFDHPAAFSMSYLLYAFAISATQPGFMGGTIPATGQASAAPSSAPRPVPWVLFTLLQLFLLFVVWRFSVLPFQASLLTIRANQLHSYSIPAAWELNRQAGEIPTPYVDEQSFMLSRDMIAYATGGQLKQLEGWHEMYEYTKSLNQRYVDEHPRNTHAHFIYARLLHEVGAVLPQEEQGAELQLAEREYRAAIETSPKRQQLYSSMARLYVMVGASEQAYEVLKTALDFNQNVGESWWYAGITRWFNLNQVEEGMKMVVQSLKVKNPYQMQSVRDALFVAQAAATLGEPEILRNILPVLPRLPGGTVEMFIAIAREYERAGLIDERNILLNAIQQADPTLAPKFEALRNGSATSIDASIGAMSAASDALAEILSASGTPSEPSTQVTTTPETAPRASGPGPRR